LILCRDLYEDTLKEYALATEDIPNLINALDNAEEYDMMLIQLQIRFLQ
jgi:hypothetical protein